MRRIYTTFLLLLIVGCSTLAERQTGSPAAYQLSEAVVNDDLDTVKELLAAGVHPDARQSKGASPPLSAAISRLNPQIAMALLEAGADPLHHFEYPGLKNPPRYSYWHYLKYIELKDVNLRSRKVMRARQDQIANALVNASKKAGILNEPIDMGDGRYGPPATVLLQQNEVKWAKMYIEAGANLNAPNYNGSYTLDAAMAMRNSDINLIRDIRDRGGLEAPAVSNDISQECKRSLNQEYGSVSPERINDILDQSNDRVIVYGANWCGYTKKQLLNLKTRRIPYTYVNAGANKNKDGERIILGMKHSRSSSSGYPTLVYKGRVYVGYHSTIGE